MERVARFQKRAAGSGVPLERPRPRAQEVEVQDIGPGGGHPGCYVVRDALLSVTGGCPLKRAADRPVGGHCSLRKGVDLLRRLDHPCAVHQVRAVDQRGAGEPLPQPVHERGLQRVALYAEAAPGETLLDHDVGQQIYGGGDELLVGAHVLDLAFVPAGYILALAEDDGRVSLSRPQEQDQPVGDESLRDYPGARKVGHVLQRAGNHAVQAGLGKQVFKTLGVHASSLLRRYGSAYQKWTG